MRILRPDTGGSRTERDDSGNRLPQWTDDEPHRGNERGLRQLVEEQARVKHDDDNCSERNAESEHRIGDAQHRTAQRDGPARE
jgi:hypothetical protein